MIKKTIFMLILSFVICWPVMASELTNTEVMNVYYGLKDKGYGGENLRKKLKSIIDGDDKFEGEAWEKHLLKAMDMKNNSKVPNRINSVLGITILSDLWGATIDLAKIASDDFKNLKIEQKENKQGKTYFVIPTDIRRSKEYLKYAIGILEQDYEIFEGHPDNGDIRKVMANQARIIDLYDEMLENYIGYLESVNVNSLKGKDYLKTYNRSRDTYEIESKKSYIYIMQKTNELLAKYNVDIQFKARETAKDLMKLERKYEKEY